MAMETFNLFKGETDEAPSTTPGYRYRAARLGSKLGGARLDEEWLIALDGRATVRTPKGEHVVDPGDVICFLAGPQGAHQVRNASDEPVRVAIFSTMNEFGIVEYPEDERVGIWAGDSHYVLDHPNS
jgi:uncharacterized cupin superfamily protein